MKKQIPFWFLIVVIVFLIYGSFSIYMNDTFYGLSLVRLAIVNLIITMVFLVFNVLMFGYFSHNNYEIEAIILTVYYVFINALNGLNIYFGWLDSYIIQRNIAIGTKIFEVIFIGRIIFLRQRRHK